MTHRLRNWAFSARTRGSLLLAFVGATNLSLWLIVWLVSSSHRLLGATALLAYGLGLRHAVDADHISAIDNTTRKLMQEGKRPIGVGFYFSLGHSTVVVLLCLALGVSTSYVQSHLPALQRMGSLIGTGISIGFLYLIGFINLIVLLNLGKSYRTLRGGARPGATEVDNLTMQGGIVAKLVRPVLALVNRSWQMYLVGFLFGLGFDTASEVGILALSARSGESHAPLWLILLFPLLFTAGMCLVDTADGLLMLGAYGWAFVEPARKLYYNLVITGISVLVAFIVGTVEIVQILTGPQSGRAFAWAWLQTIDLERGGYWIIALFVASWGLSRLTYKVKVRRTANLSTTDA